MQYNGTVKNTSQVTIKSWQAEVDMPAGTSIVQNWGCECEMSGTKLVLKPADYTSEIAAGGSKGDIGPSPEISPVTVRQQIQARKVAETAAEAAVAAEEAEVAEQPVLQHR